jgi:hypothetical protein
VLARWFGRHPICFIMLLGSGWADHNAEGQDLAQISNDQCLEMKRCGKGTRGKWDTTGSPQHIPFGCEEEGSQSSASDISSASYISVNLLLVICIFLTAVDAIHKDVQAWCNFIIRDFLYAAAVLFTSPLAVSFFWRPPEALARLAARVQSPRIALYCMMENIWRVNVIEGEIL